MRISFDAAAEIYDKKRDPPRQVIKQEKPQRIFNISEDL